MLLRAIPPNIDNDLVVPDTEIRALLAELKAGIEATAVGVLDGGRSWLHASSEQSPGSFWAAFNGLTCLVPDWERWEAELLTSGAARVACDCGGHFVDAFRIRELWAVIVLSSGALAPAATQVVRHALPILSRLLPAVGSKPRSAPPAGGGSGGEGQGPAELGIPAWWIRKRAAD
jgi:hypothetical protein